MVKRITIIALTLLIGFPLSVFGAAQVVLTAVTISLSSPSTTLTIEGDTVHQIVVNTTSTVITMNGGGGSATITNSDRYRFTVSGISNSQLTCSAGSSQLVLPAQATDVEITVTPSTVCSSGGDGGTPVSGGGGSPPPASTPTATPSTTTGNVTATATQGGNTTVETSDGTTAGVDVPSNALSADTTFTVSSIAKTSSDVSARVAAVPSGKQVVGNNLFSYGATVANSSVSTFNAALTLSFTYTDAQVTGLSLTSLKVYYYDETSGEWVALTTVVDTTTKIITATTDHFTYFAIFGEEAAGEVELVDETGSAIADGDLITTATSFDIYIVKLIGSKKFKRLILNPDIFNSYGHLSWGNVKTVSQNVQDAYTIADLVIEVNEDGSVADPKVYRVSSSLDADVGVKQWLNMTVEQFEAEGYDWDSIYKINRTEASADFYPESDAITSDK